MKNLRYLTGQEIQAGDRILLHGEPGEVEYVVVSRTGDVAIDWHLDEHPDGGIGIKNREFGNVFISAASLDDRLEFVSRRP
jgi:hypothetical protein